MGKPNSSLNDESLTLLEYPRILEEIASYAKSPATSKAILYLSPLLEMKKIEERFILIKDIRRIICEEGDLPLKEFEDISEDLHRLRPEGSFLEPLELFRFTRIFENIQSLRIYTKNRKDISHLSELIDGFGKFDSLLDVLFLSIDSEGNILDSASPLLNEIRMKKKNLENRIRKKINEIIMDDKISGFLQDQYITLRSGRWVIPLKANFKGQLPGVIHDISRTGETLYLEPFEIIGLSNEHENFIAEEKAEVIRILKGISDMLRLRLSEITRSYELLVYIDVLRSISLFCERFKLETPEITNTKKLRLSNARHPILLLLKEKGLIEDVIPMNLEIDEASRIVIITGPNAGGKTIALKTVGLLTAMALTGIPVPAGSGTVIPLIKDILIDIGDEQSIEQSLSSFSAHMMKISEIIKIANSNSLVLLDELGRATEPEEGSALGISILEELFKNNPFVIATTHLINIAIYLAGRKGYVNASMEFDPFNLRPLYILKTGEPGFSHGLMIAKRMGLPENIVDHARTLLSSQKIELENTLMGLKQKRDYYEKELKRLKELNALLLERGRLISEKEKEIEKIREEILKKSIEETKALLNDTKRFINQLLIEAKKSPKQAMKELREKEKQIDDLRRSFIKEEFFEPEVGSTVYVKSLGYDGVVTRIKKDEGRVWIRSGAFEIEVPVLDIGHPRGISINFPEDRTYNNEEHVTDSINLAGLRIEEALSRLEPYLNHAFLSGKSEVKIIHGIGTGRLKGAIRDYLKHHPLVVAFRPGSEVEGGEGITMVRLR